MNIRRLSYFAMFALLVLTPVGLISYKLLVLKYPLADLIPAVSYQVDIGMSVDGHGGNIRMRTYLPKSDARQTISNEESAAGLFNLDMQSDEHNRLASWSAENVGNQQSIRYTFSVQADHVRYVIPPELTVPDSYPDSFAKYLMAEPGIQVSDPIIDQLIDEIIPDRKAPMLELLRSIHRHLQDKLTNRNFSGYTEAITALKLGEASCNGKGRLFVSLARKLGIPARLVGGLIMTQGSKRVSHQWVEAYVNGHWVPFDTINDHFAELPANFLTLYYGDLVLFQHSTNVNFQYFFKISKRLVSRASADISASNVNMVDLYATFERIGISQNLLKIILMIPIGALIVVIFRNVVGLETFGTFLPALIAAAARETGLVWGLVGFLLIIVLTSFIRRGLDWMQLLHSPKMSILLTSVVILILGLTVLGVQAGLVELAHVSLFPIAILAITAERFAIMEIEQGWAKTMKITLATMVVIAAAYVVMDSLFLQSMTLAFPELLLLLIALNLWLGKWMGMRVLEFFRFRRLILQKAS